MEGWTPLILLLLFTHLQREGGLLVVDPDKDLPNYQLLAVIAEDELGTEALIAFTLLGEDGMKLKYLMKEQKQS